MNWWKMVIYIIIQGCGSRSIWIHTLKLPWQLGAELFMKLLDADPASNTLSWRWVAGNHTLGKTYLANPSNIKKYTGGRLFPENQLALKAVESNQDGTIEISNIKLKKKEIQSLLTVY